MENQVEKTMENELETGIRRGLGFCLGFRFRGKGLEVRPPSH